MASTKFESIPLLLLMVLFNTIYVTIQLPFVHLYVVPFSLSFSNITNGSRTHPYSSLQQTLNHVERQYHQNITSKRRIITINLYPTYYFVDTVHFNRFHSHVRLTTMTTTDTDFYTSMNNKNHVYQRLITATISGGIPITDWNHVSGNIYSAVISSFSHSSESGVISIFESSTPRRGRRCSSIFF